MKKAALISLTLLISIESVSACSYASDPNNLNVIDATAQSTNYSLLYFFLSVFLVCANICLYFYRGQKDHYVLILIGLTCFIMIPLNFFGLILENCGFLKDTLWLDLLIFSLITVFHLGLWITKRRLDFGTDEIDFTFIRLQ